VVGESTTAGDRLMAGGVSLNLSSNSPSRRATRDPWWVKWTVIVLGTAFLVFFLVLPLVAIFAEAFRKGFAAYFASFKSRDAWSAITLTLTVAAIAVPLNIVFGLVASWCIAKFNFIGKNILITLIDLPFAVSPVISGLIYVLMFGSQGWFGPWFKAHHMPIIFVTFPFVARELIPLMESQGTQEEEASLVLGAGALKTFWYVTLPNVKWALLYGVILCNARAMGEFGAVSVVSGAIRGKTATLPLYVEILYNEYNAVAAFAVASLLAILGLVTLVVKTIVERRAGA
jgi:sulfate transport system permease protein